MKQKLLLPCYQNGVPSMTGHKPQLYRAYSYSWDVTLSFNRKIRLSLSWRFRPSRLTKPLNDMTWSTTMCTHTGCCLGSGLGMLLGWWSQWKIAFSTSFASTRSITIWKHIVKFKCFLLTPKWSKSVVKNSGLNPSHGSRLGPCLNHA